MKKILSTTFLGILSLFLSSCGQDSSQRFSESLGIKDTETNLCPLEFPKQGLCGKLIWETGPTADGVSSLRLVFWNPKDSAKGYQDPQGELKLFFRMSCCGTIKVPKMIKAGAGDFQFKDLQFIPGNWEIHIQIHQGIHFEEKIELISLNV